MEDELAAHIRKVIKRRLLLSLFQCVSSADGKMKKTPGGSCTNMPASKFTSQAMSLSLKKPTEMSRI
jgi:hypothetical protein